MVRRRVAPEPAADLHNESAVNEPGPEAAVTSTGERSLGAMSLR